MNAGVIGMKVQGAKADPHASSYLSVNEDDFRTVFSKMSGAKAQVMKRQMELLGARYDLGDRPAAGVTMSRGKPIQDGVRVKLPAGATWEALEKTSPDEIREKRLFPSGFLPLPHPNHPDGGMGLPPLLIDEAQQHAGT